MGTALNYHGGIKRDKTDIVFSFLVRERADWRCEYCRRCYRHDPAALHCSHIFGRRNKGIRWHPNGAFAHCNYDHQFLGENPVIFTEWAAKQLGREVFERLKVLVGAPTKFTTFDKELIHKHYLSEKKRLLALRAAGARGRIEFTTI